MCNLTRIPSKITITPPWIPPGYLYRPDVTGLHTEIEHFYTYMRPTSTEHALRAQVVRRMESLVSQVWPDARAEVFGSYRIGMFLPTSDIDIIVIGARDKLPLRVFAAKILASNIARPNSIFVYENRTVPIIKMIDRASKIKVDISFSNHIGVRKVELINEYKRKNLVLSKLVMVLKYFLTLYNLKDSLSGGISSFSLTLMCISFLQLQPIHKVGDSANLGILLMEFLELYGREFDYNTTCIRIGNGGQCLMKEKTLHAMVNGHQARFLCIEDPLSPGMNTCSASVRAPYVKCAFENAFILLSDAMSSKRITNSCTTRNTLLGKIFQGTEELIEYRNWIRDTHF